MPIVLTAGIVLVETRAIHRLSARGRIGTWTRLMDGRLPLWPDARRSLRRDPVDSGRPARRPCGRERLRDHRPQGVCPQRAQGRPELRSSAAPVAPAWIEAEHPAVRNAPLERDDWWSVFDDPTLTTLIQRAYEQNPTLRVVGARSLEARAGQAIAVGNIFPQSQAGARVLRPGQSQPQHAPDQASLPAAGHLSRSPTGSSAST